MNNKYWCTWLFFPPEGHSDTGSDSKGAKDSDSTRDSGKKKFWANVWAIFPLNQDHQKGDWGKLYLYIMFPVDEMALCFFNKTDHCGVFQEKAALLDHQPAARRILMRHPKCYKPLN